MKSKLIAALVASAGLAWGTAHAAPDIANAPSDGTPVIVLELQPIPGVEPGSEQEQAIVAMLLQQLLSAMQAEGDSVEVQRIQPVQGQRI
jgi:hypothetical protein